MSEYQEIRWSRVAIDSRHKPSGRTADSYSPILSNLSPAFREILGGWLVCLAIAAGCFGGLAAAGVAGDGRSAALISLDRVATVADETDRAVDADRQRRC